MIDPRHNRDIPLGRPLARVVRAHLKQIGRRVLASIEAHGRIPSLLPYVLPIFEDASPIMGRYFARGGNQLMRRIARKKGESKLVASVSTKAAHEGARDFLSGIFGQVQETIQIRFDVFNPLVIEQIRHMTLQFVRETLETAATDAAHAYAAVRSEIASGLEAGEAQIDLTRRMGRIFNSPLRAHRIGVTESSRFMHAGEYEAAKQSGIVAGMKWLASNDACPYCTKLDGKVVPLGMPFDVKPKGGPYAVVYHPPAHPSCFLCN